MALIELTTKISAPAAVCFDLARSIDLHQESMKHTGEQAIGGVMSGLINVNETVTWRARHFGVWFKLTSRIKELRYADYFIDEQVKGPFKYIYHVHRFNEMAGVTTMTDEFIFASPFGVFGKLVDRVMMKKYLIKILTARNEMIKQKAEGMPAVR